MLDSSTARPRSASGCRSLALRNQNTVRSSHFSQQMRKRAPLLPLPPSRHHQHLDKRPLFAAMLRPTPLFSTASRLLPLSTTTSRRAHSCKISTHHAPGTRQAITVRFRGRRFRACTPHPVATRVWSLPRTPTASSIPSISFDFAPSLSARAAGVDLDYRFAVDMVSTDLDGLDAMNRRQKVQFTPPKVRVVVVELDASHAPDPLPLCFLTFPSFPRAPFDRAIHSDSWKSCTPFTPAEPSFLCLSCER